jgi:hypothetical protein
MPPRISCHDVQNDFLADMCRFSQDPLYQVLEFAEPFNFRSRNPRVPAPPAKSV